LDLHISTLKSFPFQLNGSVNRRFQVNWFAGKGFSSGAIGVLLTLMQGELLR